MTSSSKLNFRWRVAFGAVVLLASAFLIDPVASNKATPSRQANLDPETQSHGSIMPHDRSRKLQSGDEIERKNDKHNSKKPFDNPRPTTPDMNFPTQAPEPKSPAAGSGDIVPYMPGIISKNKENGMFLSQGLKSRIIAETGEKVKYHNGDESNEKFHSWPDGGDVFADTRAENPGGWIYLSNSEEDIEGKGGVGALTFSAEGNLIDYRMVLSGTTMNCNGGSTHFGAWISCEEDFWGRAGKAWQVDPMGIREPQPITMSLGGGIFEAYAEDVRDLAHPQFFLTEDDYYGALMRWQPTNADWSDPWSVLLGEGISDYLVLLPNQNNHTHGLFTWVPRKQQAQRNAGMYYPNSEGIAIYKNLLYFVCKRFNHLFVLDLDKMTYTRHSTLSETFDGTPDGVRTYIKSTEDGEEEAMLYFTEDGGKMAGIHAQNANGQIVPVLEGDYEPETTGLSFTPDGKRMYFAFQEDGYIVEVQRIDGRSFHAKTLNVKQHQYEADMSVVSDRRRRRDRRNI